MDYFRQKMVKEQLYRLRMYAYSSLQFNPLKQNKFLDRKKQIFTKDKATTLECACHKTKKISRMINDNQDKNQKNQSGVQQHVTDYSSFSYNCGEKCFNRGMNCECSQLSCPSNIYCTNRHFQLFQDRFVYPIKTKFKGWGLAAGEFIPKGSFIMQYVGEIFNIDSEIGRKRINKYKNSTCTYLMRIDNNEVIDPTTSGNIARFINHSCDPNCQTSKWSVLDEVCVGIFSIKDIQENEELTFNYQFDFFKTPFTRCYCDSFNCKKYLGVATGVESSDPSSQSDEVSSDSGTSSQTCSNGEADNSSVSSESEQEKQVSQILERELPMCQYCNNPIQDSKQILICKGPCNQLFHDFCATKLNSTLKKESNLQINRRKFLCKNCYYVQTGFKKRGRKSIKETQNNVDNLRGFPKSNQLKVSDEIIKSKCLNVFEDPETQRIMENSIQNLLVDRIVLLNFRKLEMQMKQLFYDRFKNYKNSSLIRQKRFQQIQFSDHYTFMFEFIRRLKFKLSKIINDSQTKNDVKTVQDIGGCTINYSKFFKEFPKIAQNQSDILIIENELNDNSRSQKWLDNLFDEEIQQNEDQEMDSAQFKLQKQQQKEDQLKLKKKRGRPKKIKAKDEEQLQNDANMDIDLENDLKQTQNQNILNSPEQKVQQNINIATNDSNSEIKKESENKEISLTSSFIKSNLDKSEISQIKDGDEEIEDEYDQLDLSFKSNSKNAGQHQQDLEMQSQNQEYNNEISDSQSPSSPTLNLNKGTLKLSLNSQDDAIQENVGIENDQQIQSKEQSLEKMDFVQEQTSPVKYFKIQKLQTQNKDKYMNNQKRGRPKKNIQEIFNKNENVNLQESKLKKIFEIDYQNKKIYEQNKQMQQQFSQKFDLNQQQSIKNNTPTKEQIIYQEYKKIREEILQFWEKFIENDQQDQQDQKEIITKSSHFNVNERVFNMVIKNHIEDLECFKYLQVFWDKPWGSNVTLQIVSTKYQYYQINSILQHTTNRIFSLHFQHKIENTISHFEIQKIRVPKNFIRKLVGYQEKSLQQFRMDPNFQVDFFYDKVLLVDDIFNLNDFTNLRIFGKRQDVLKVTQYLTNMLDQIQMKSIMIQKVDCNLVMDFVKEIKSLLDPCEIRIKQSDNIIKDLRHPFLFLPNYLKDIILIGTQEEINIAEKKLQGFIRQKREGQNFVTNQQISFLLPICLKYEIENLKAKISKSHQNVQIFHYLPTYPRKHLTITLIGPWSQLVETKLLLIQHSEFQLTQNYRSYQTFEWSVFFQQIRFAFKNLKRYILEKNLKYLSHWDIVSVFVKGVQQKNDGNFQLNDIQLSNQEIQQLLIEKQKELKLDLKQDFSDSCFNSIKTGMQLYKQESFLEALLQSEDEELSLNVQNIKKYNSCIPETKGNEMTNLDPSVKGFESLKMSENQKFMIDRADIINLHKQKIQQIHQNEQLQLIQYIKEDDPETCLNILFVLSQCKNFQLSGNKKQINSDKLQQIDELQTLMERLNINSHFVVKSMQQVLSNNLSKFMHSLGKSRYHLKQFESSSSSCEEKNSRYQSHYHQKYGVRLSKFSDKQEDHSLKNNYFQNKTENSDEFSKNTPAKQNNQPAETRTFRRQNKKSGFTDKVDNQAFVEQKQTNFQEREVFSINRCKTDDINSLKQSNQQFPKANQNYKQVNYNANLRENSSGSKYQSRQIKYEHNIQSEKAYQDEQESENQNYLLNRFKDQNKYKSSRFNDCENQNKPRKREIKQYQKADIERHFDYHNQEYLNRKKIKLDEYPQDTDHNYQRDISKNYNKDISNQSLQNDYQPPEYQQETRVVMMQGQGDMVENTTNQNYKKYKNSSPAAKNESYRNYREVDTYKLNYYKQNEQFADKNQISKRTQSEVMHQQYLEQIKNSPSHQDSNRESNGQQYEYQANKYNLKNIINQQNSDNKCDFVDKQVPIHLQLNLKQDYQNNFEYKKGFSNKPQYYNKKPFKYDKNYQQDNYKDYYYQKQYFQKNYKSYQDFN